MGGLGPAGGQLDEIDERSAADIESELARQLSHVEQRIVRGGVRRPRLQLQGAIQERFEAGGKPGAAADLRDVRYFTGNRREAFRVALREYAPDVVLLPGPGASLGAACAQLIVAEGYRGIRSRAEFEAALAGPSPILLSMRR